ncbi:hypothetical protein [Sediminibacter sp. Hel_I_10]|uniref:hypothetical protein n=1 Tax=Sediminibacter sp. Hel_I_10 TaxID=1392490 RepID=UPI00047B8806|nr:hypothetical protein [Sediminibacter sp. Hel_I_10]
MIRIFTILLCFFSLHTTLNAQNATDEKEKERYEEQVEENKQKFLNEFIKTLDVDDFQKEIIRQTMDSYFDEVVKISKLGLKSFEAKDEVVKMRARHFTDVRAIVNEDVMMKIEDALTGKWNPKDEKKKRKKRKKNND